MKSFKKIMALVIAMVMVLGTTAFAGDINGDSGTEGGTEGGTAATTTNARTLDDKISVEGLEIGDVVRYYKVLEWNDSKGWKLTDNFASLTTTGKSGDYVLGSTTDEQNIRDDFAKDVLKYIAGLPAKILTYNADGFVATKENAVPGRINSTLAAQIATIAQGLTADGTSSALTGTQWELAISDETDSVVNEPGLYLILIDAAEKGVVYNPIFVGADYTKNPSDTTGIGDSTFENKWETDADLSYSDRAIAKKTTITVDKTTDDQDGDAAVEEGTDLPGIEGDKSVNEMSTADTGELIKFVVETTIPEYADNYTNIIFSITDNLTTGLKLDTTSTVGTGTSAMKIETLDPTTSAVVEDITSKTIQISSSDVSIYKAGKAPSDVTNDGTSFEIVFTHDYLHSLDAATPIRITYYARATEDLDGQNINIGNNTVTVKYSNNPNDSSDYGVLKDVTNHYTFSIDADIFGSKEYETSELVKIGVDKDGNILTEKKPLDNGVETSVLQGAKFALFTDDTIATAVAGGNKTLTDADVVAKIYKNYKDDGTTVNFDGSEITSDANGKLNIHGLDVGKYYLVETAAPAGYIADSTVHTIEISAEYEEKELTEVIDGKTVEYTTQVLKKYTIKVDNTVSTYTVNYAQDGSGHTEDAPSLHLVNTSDKDTDDSDTNNDLSDNSHFIINTQGTELPSTGGTGTVMLYTFGAILVLAAGILLVTKRRAA